MSGDEFLDYAFPFLKKMFPRLERDWIKAHHLWRARWSQPVVEKHYSRLIPAEEGPLRGPLPLLDGADLPGRPRHQLRDPGGA